jgi:DNA-binding transcriptional LysR family regulator
VLGSADYLARHGTPRSPEDLVLHQCIGYRFPTAKAVYRWQFQRGGRPFSVDVAGSLIVNDHLAMIALAKAGAGLAYTADLVAAGEMEEGSLRPVLQAFGLSSRGLHMYFPRRSQAQPKLRAFIDFTKQALRAVRG